MENEKQTEDPNQAVERLNRILANVRDLLQRTMENQKLLHAEVEKLGLVVKDHHRFFKELVKAEQSEPPERILN